MNKYSRIFVAGHRGLVGSAISRKLESLGFNNLITRASMELDLTRQQDVEYFFKEQKPEYVFLAAAKVGGILANHTYPADFIYKNLMIEANVIHASYLNDVKKLLFLGSSCIYPRLAPQPIKEEYLLTGELEPTNEPYAVAKIAGIKMCQAYNRQYGCNFIQAMPTNLYGPFDNFDLQSSHVLPAMIRKFHEAKISPEKRPVVIWGSGAPKREFLYIDDLADACAFLMEGYDGPGVVNVGMGLDVSISQLASMVKEITGYDGQVVYDKTKPDGMPRKMLDVSKINSMGWKYSVSLEEGIKRTYQWYLENCGK